MDKFNFAKSVNKKYFVLALIALLGGISLYVGVSYGLFKKVDYLTNVDFVAGTLNYKIENDELSNNSIVVGSGNQHKLTLNLTSLNTVDSKYELYYLIDGEKVTSDEIEIGYASESVDSVKGTISANKTKRITVNIKNNSSKAVTITFGCEGGLINNTLVMSKGNSLDNLILDSDVMLAYTYIGTGTKPSKFPTIDDGYYVTDLVCTGGTAFWDNDTWSMKITSTTASSISCNATIADPYKDNSGAAVPVLKGDLIPVIISDKGVVTKASLGAEWYNYDKSMWANAVILNDDYGPYSDNEIIPEEAIESYFVWIPRYEYKIFDEGNYTEILTTPGSAVQEIEIQFVDKDNDAVKNGSTVGTWLTHPAFTSFDSNGMWVGKFESGYKGATSTSEAQKNVFDSSKLIIKPNVYSWRGIQVANAHQTSFNYNRDLDSHMMKNTEWGAVAYLSHSKYGNMDSVRINNNSGYITGYAAIDEPTVAYSNDGNKNENTLPKVDGLYTVNYSNSQSVVASTTGNYSGIYDMSAGAHEYVMGVVLDTAGKPYSGRNNLYESGFKGNYGCPTCDSTVSGIDSSITANTTGVDFPTDTKYYDTYANTSHWIKFNTRILGDATGEMGPVYNEIDKDTNSRNKSYWYADLAHFVEKNYPWFLRGNDWYGGTASGIFSFSCDKGTSYLSVSFRVVLTP